MTAPALTSRQPYPSLAYVLPFAVFLFLLAVQGLLTPLGRAEPPFRFLLLTGVLLAYSRPVLGQRASQPLLSAAFGLAVFALWIAPDLLFPHYRQSWPFQNALFGAQHNSFNTTFRQDSPLLVFRTLRAVLLVPVLEELFWRGWLMRWLIEPDFQSVPLGTYRPQAFWFTAALFAVEHGTYWDVGLATGLLYNWWMIRTRNLTDCIIAHAVTNLALSVYVVEAGQWQYWQ